MARPRTPVRRAVGKLIMELDREYMRAVEDGQPTEWLQSALDKAHDFLGCETDSEVRGILGPKTMVRFFGSLKSQSFPRVAAKLAELDLLLLRTSSLDEAGA